MTELNRVQAEARSTRVGASEVSAIMGTSKYNTPATVYDRIIGGVAIEPTQQMRVGSLLEDKFVPMLRWHGIVARRCWLAYVDMDPDVALSATPDFFIKPHGRYDKPGLVEAKVSSAHIIEGAVPEWWKDQLTVQMGLTGRHENVWLAVLNGSHFTVTEVPWDNVRWLEIREAVREFTLGHLRPRIRPVDPPFTL